MNMRRLSSLVCLAVLVLMMAACASTSKKTMAGYWMDANGNVTRIDEKDGGYEAVTNYYTITASSQNALVSSSYENDVLTWKYCPPARPCITMHTVSFKGDTLDVTWTNDKGDSGTMTLTRSVEYIGRGNS